MASVRTLLAASLVLGFSALAAGQSQAETLCSTMIIRDENGTAIPSDQPIVGMLVDGIGPLVNQVVPPMASVHPDKPAECPADLVKAIQDLFDANCLTDKGRETAAKENEQRADVVNQRCQSLYRALNPKK
ncbi:MAG: hypothetical protein JNK21_09785 [Rhodospirillaceae bacterium]|nr:hypothetical protein [Rhodospirillaceae bacterium]